MFSHHAKDRLREFRISLSTAYYDLCDATQEKAPNGKYKKERYNGNQGIVYLRFGPVIFTGKRILDFRTRDPIFLVITVTDQRVTLHKYGESVF